MLRTPPHQKTIFGLSNAINHTAPIAGMFAFLLPIALGLLFFIIYRREQCWRRSLLLAAIAWGIWLVFLTEGLNLLGKINVPWVLTGWLCFVVGLSVIWVRDWGLGRSSHFKLRSLLSVRLTAFQWFSLGSMGAIALVLAVVAIVAAPNTADSMIYHLARVANWIQNQNINPYPTRVVLQLDQPPWNSYAYLHLMLLSGGDFYVGLVQWSCLSLNAIGVSLIAESLGANLTGQWLASVLCMTLPMALLQASTAQNDLIVSFWLICFMVSILDLAQHRVRRTHALELGASLGLALFTKGTAYIYTPPMILLALWSIMRPIRWQSARFLGVTSLMVVGVNAGHWWRNWVVFGSPLGIGGDATRNQLLTAPALVSNIMRNLGMHLDSVIPGWNPIINALVLQLHEWIGIRTNNPLTTWEDHNFFLPESPLLPIALTEDRSGNPVHLLLILFSLVLLLGRRKLWSWRLGSYLAILIVGFLMFCLLLKWQIWGTRLHLPLFVLMTPVVSVVLTKTVSNRAFRYAMVSVLLVLALPYLLFSMNRPLIVNETLSQWFRVHPQSILTAPRESMYYTSMVPRIRRMMPDVIGLVQAQNCYQIGLDTRLEYPFWATLQQRQKPDDPVFYFKSVVNEAPKVDAFAQPSRWFTPCAVIRIDPHTEQLPLENAEQYRLAFEVTRKPGARGHLQLYLHDPQF